MMQRLIAQAVLWALLGGMFAPLAPAAVLPHACCLRHQQHCHMPRDAGISSRNCCHECCRLIAVSTALFTPVQGRTHARLAASPLIWFSRSSFQPSQVPAERSERGPPRLG